MVSRRSRGGKKHDFWSSAGHGEAKNTIFGHLSPTDDHLSWFLVISARKMTKKTEKPPFFRAPSGASERVRQFPTQDRALNPGAGARLCRRPAAAVWEMLRLAFSTVALRFRGPKAVTIRGAKIQAGQRVAASSALPRTHVRLHT